VGLYVTVKVIRFKTKIILTIGKHHRHFTVFGYAAQILVIRSG
jgi:hypothetical protein